MPMPVLGFHQKTPKQFHQHNAETPPREETMREIHKEEETRYIPK